MNPTASAGRPSTYGRQPGFAHATYEIARKEALQLLRTKRLIIMAIIIAVVMALLSVLVPVTFFPPDQIGDIFGGDENAQQFDAANFAILFFLSSIFLLSGYFFLQLMPILLTADAVCSEWSNRTIFLLLSKPVPRAAFVLGKFIGITVPIVAFTAVILLLDYATLALIYETPSAEGWRRFFGALGVILLGVMSFAAVALFFSTIMKSTVGSMLVTIVMWIVGFRLLGLLDFFIALIRYGGDVFEMSASEAGRGWSVYLNPAALMSHASNVLSEFNPFDFLSLTGGGTPPTWGVVLALSLHTLVWVTLSVVVVQLRNFE